MGARTGGKKEYQPLSEGASGHSVVIGSSTRSQEACCVVLPNFSTTLFTHLLEINRFQRTLLGREVFLTILLRAAYMPWGSWSLGPGRSGLAAWLWASGGWRGEAARWRGCSLGSRSISAWGGTVEGSWTPPCIPAWPWGWDVGPPPAGRAFCFSCCSQHWLANSWLDACNFDFILHKWNEIIHKVIEISRCQDNLSCHRESDEQILLLLLDMAPSVAHTLRLPLTFWELHVKE